MLQAPLPKRTRVLILGGGIHGVGLLHDLVSRGWTDTHLLEKGDLGAGTSSKSTKLIHGGLRYLRRITQMNMVAESIRERSFLLEVASDIVHPIELVIPWQKHAYLQPMYVRCGLFLYDFLVHRPNGVHHHRSLNIAALQDKTPILDTELYPKAFSFWDAQTDDLALVNRVAASAVAQGGQISTHTQALRIVPEEDGWRVFVRSPQGEEVSISARYVVNAMGPWANTWLEGSGIRPSCAAVKNKGIHIPLPELGLKAGLFLPTADQRFIFVLPWLGYTLVGTTESDYQGDPDLVRAEDQEVSELLAFCNRFLRIKLTESMILRTFAGIRWLATESHQTLSSMSRESVIGCIEANKGVLFTIYGGKLTSYRSLSEKLGTKILGHYGDNTPSRTRERNSWLGGTQVAIPDPLQRF